MKSLAIILQLSAIQKHKQKSALKIWIQDSIHTSIREKRHRTQPVLSVLMRRSSRQSNSKSIRSGDNQRPHTSGTDGFIKQTTGRRRSEHTMNPVKHDNDIDMARSPNWSFDNNEGAPFDDEVEQSILHDELELVEDLEPSVPSLQTEEQTVSVGSAPHSTYLSLSSSSSSFSFSFSSF